MLSAAATAAAHHLTTREALSGIWGSISLCAWIFLLVSLPYLSHLLCSPQPLPYKGVSILLLCTST